MERSAKVLLTYISIVHAISHIHIMTLPALLPILPKAIHVSFMELGIAIGVFNVVSLLVQAPFGFLVDRLGARKMLIYALLLGTVSFTLVFISTSYISLIVAMALAGVANGVYHPANYALLSTGILTKQMGRAFSIHTFSGFFGAAITPLMMIGIGPHCQNSCHPHPNNLNGGKGDNHGTIQSRTQTSNTKQTAIA